MWILRKKPWRNNFYFWRFNMEYYEKFWLLITTQKSNLIWNNYCLFILDTTSNRPSKKIKLPRAKDGQIPYELDFNIKVLSPREIIGVTFVDERDQNEAQLNKGKEGNQYFAEVRKLQTWQFSGPSGPFYVLQIINLWGPVV